MVIFWQARSPHLENRRRSIFSFDMLNYFFSMKRKKVGGFDTFLAIDCFSVVEWMPRFSQAILASESFQLALFEWRHSLWAGEEM